MGAEGDKGTKMLPDLVLTVTSVRHWSQVFRQDLNIDIATTVVHTSTV